ncbi:MAG TPA: ATP-binding protein [Gaiellaceae bacterium]|nr:ATP-binding protein [Gaiellaceae bacterium]
MPSFARGRYSVTLAALACMGATWGIMLALDWSVTLGTVALAPWVALIGFDLGVVGAAAAGLLATAAWVLATEIADRNWSAGQVVVRAAALVLLGAGTAIAGRRLRAQQRELRRTAALQTALLDATIDGICLTDADGELLIANKPLRMMTRELGLPQSGTVPERLLAIADAMTEPERYRERMQALAHAPGDASIDEFEVAGTGRVFRGYTSPVPEGRIWTLREITADRELDRMRDAFVATVSHELRTPLTSISGFLEMLEDEQHALGDAGRQYLDVIRRGTDRLHALVEDLLLVAQIEARRVELQLAPVDLAKITELAVEAMRPAATEKGIVLDVGIDSPPPVLADALRVRQVVDNLLSNAVKFTPQGGSVSVSVEAVGDGGRLVVADTGIGVPADEQKQVFSRFFRSSTAASRAIPGTGLGLAICHALIEQHGGSIAFASREGEGTEVSVTLPAA